MILVIQTLTKQITKKTPKPINFLKLNNWKKLLDIKLIITHMHILDYLLA